MADMVPVRVPGLQEPVLFPRGMSEADIQSAIERDILPTLQAAPTPGPSTHPWVQTNEMARQGKAPTGEPLGQALTQGGVGLAADAVRLGPPLAASAAPMIAAPVAAGSEAAAQGLEMLGGTRESFDPTAVGMAGAIPPAMAGVGATMRAVARRLPGVGATLHDMAKQSLERLATIFGPAQSSDELYAFVRQQNPHVAMPQLKATAGKLLDEEKLAEVGLDLSAVAKTAKGLGQRLEVPAPGVNPGEMPFDRAFLNLKRIGGKIRETRIAGGEEHGAWKALWKAGMDDLEAAAAAGAEAAPAVRALKQANAAARREYVQEEIADIFSRGGLSARPDIGPDAFSVNFGKIANDLRKGKHAEDIKAVLKPEEYKELLQHVSDLAKQTPNLPPPRGQFAGSAVRLGQVAAGGAAGFLASDALGLPKDQATALGVLAGSKGVDQLTRLLMSDAGRKLLSSFLSRSGGIITDKSLTVLALAAANHPDVRGAANSGAVQLGDLGRRAFMEPR
jgi:hypothetical protein